MRCNHQWELMKDDKHEKCTLCSTVYPCLLNCKHWDCIVDKGQQLPEWVTYVKGEKV